MKLRKWLVPILLAGILGGCNFFSFTGGPGSSSDYIESGRAKLNDGDYQGALEDFRHAVEQDNLNSEALYLHAKASLLVSGFNVFTLVTTMTESDRPDETPLPFLDWSVDSANTLYAANITIHADLRPIVLGLTHGPITLDDISFDYVIANLIEAILRLRDTNADGVIDENDFPLDVIYDAQSGNFNIGNLEEFWGYLADFCAGDLQCQADIVNTMIDNVVLLVGTSRDLLGLISEDLPYDEEDINEITAGINEGIQLFYVNDHWDNDGDGQVDEEAIDGLDNDLDFLIDEDTHY